MKSFVMREIFKFSICLILILIFLQNYHTEHREAIILGYFLFSQVAVAMILRVYMLLKNKK
jgi:F0F1-type ATP synthase assembly protein I